MVATALRHYISVCILIVMRMCCNLNPCKQYDIGNHCYLGLFQKKSCSQEMTTSADA